MTWWQRLRGESLAIRPATPADRPVLADLLLRAIRKVGNSALEERESLLGSGASYLAYAGDQAVGFVGIRPRMPVGEERWADVALIALATSSAAGSTLSGLLHAALPGMRKRDITGLVCLASEGWLRNALADADFREVDRVITYIRRGRSSIETPVQVADLHTAGPADANAVLTLNNAAFTPLWCYDASTILSWLLTSDHAVLAEVEGRPAGFALTSRASADSYAQLIRIATHPDFQGRGIGRQLVADAVAFAERTGTPGVALNTQLTNDVSRHLYETLGFRLSGPPVSVMTRPVDGVGRNSGLVGAVE